MVEAHVFQPIAARPPPGGQVGALAWVRKSFFDGWLNSLLTLVVLAVLVVALPPLFGWSIWHAVAVPDNALCRAQHHVGACWGVVAEKGRLILLGRYVCTAKKPDCPNCVMQDICPKIGVAR